MNEQAYKPRLDGECGFVPPIASEIMFEIATALPRQGESGQFCDPFNLTDGANVAQGATSAFVTVPPRGSNLVCVVTGIAFQWEVEDYQTSPVFLQDFNAKPGEAAGGAIGAKVRAGPFKSKLGSFVTPFAFPNLFGMGLPCFPRGVGACLVIKNNEQTGTFHARGLICGFFFDARQSDSVRKRASAHARGNLGVFGH